MKALKLNYRSFAVFALVAGIFLSPLLTASDAAAEVFEVEIKGFAFHPAKLSVKPGDVIRWVNKDIAPHTATSDDESWDSGELSNGGVAEIEMTKAGVFSYLCIYHPAMKGEITVVAEP